jgi:DNA excision repair protein ERCC-2
LRRHFEEDGGAYAFLVDEAHNLVDRAREMFSAELDGRVILDVKRAIKQAAPRCAKALTQLHTAMRKLGNSIESHEESFESSDTSVELNLFPAKATTIRREENGVSTSPEFPDNLIEPLETALEEAERWLVKNQPA